MAADITIFTSMGSLSGVTDLAAAYEKASGHKVMVARRIGPALPKALNSNEPGDIVASIQSKPATPRVCTEDEPTLLDIRGKIERHMKNTYLKRIDTPIGVKPALRCWMELNEANQ